MVINEKKSGWVKVEMSIHIGTDALSEAGSKHPCADIPSRHFLRRAVGRGHHLSPLCNVQYRRDGSF